MKRLLSAVFALIIITSILFAASDFKVAADEGIKYSFKQTVLTISGEGAMEDYTLILSDDGVTEILASSAPWCSYEAFGFVEKIVISDNITHIGNYSFYNFSAPQGLYLPKSVVSIGNNAFDGYCDFLSADYRCHIKDVYYSGSINDRFKIDIAPGNDALLNATWHYAVDEPQTVTLFKNSDGKWCYYPDGQKSTVTTLTNHKGKWFYVENGVWNTKYTGFFKYKSKWFYIENGKWNRSVETMTKYKGKWFYIKNGKWDSDATKFFKYKGKTFYIKNGKWDKTITTLAKYNGKLRYVKNGKLCNDSLFFEYKGK